MRRFCGRSRRIFRSVVRSAATSTSRSAASRRRPATATRRSASSSGGRLRSCSRRLEELPLPGAAPAGGGGRGLHTWGLTQLLLQRSREVDLRGSEKGPRAGRAGGVVSRHLSSAYDPGWVLDLRARAYAHLGNALRVVGELLSAEASFRKAESCLARSRTGNAWAEAEVLDMKGSLRHGPEEVRRERGAFRCGLATSIARRGIPMASARSSSSEPSSSGRWRTWSRRSSWLRRELAQEIDRCPGAAPVRVCEAQPARAASVVAGRHRGSLELLPEVRDLFRDSRPPSGPGPAPLDGGRHRLRPGPARTRPRPRTARSSGSS